MAAGFLKRCPSCLRNLVQHLCEFTCSPVQSDFVHVKSIEVNKVTKKEYVTEVDLHVSEEYINGTYDSCKQVISSKFFISHVLILIVIFHLIGFNPIYGSIGPGYHVWWMGLTQLQSKEMVSLYGWHGNKSICPLSNKLRVTYRK